MSKAGSDVQKFGKNVREAGESANLASGTFTTLVGTALKMGAVLGTTSIGLGTLAMKTSMDMDKAFGEIEASMDGMAMITDKRVKQMKWAFQDLSMRIPVDVKEMAEGAVVALKEFGDIPDLTSRVEKAVIAAYGGGGTVPHAMMGAGQIMHSFSDMTRETFDYIIERMPLLARKSNADFDQFTRAIGRAAPLFADIGGTIPEFLASFAEMTKVVGGRSSIVGFQMASLLNSLAKYEDVKKVIKKVGWTGFLEALNVHFRGNAKQSKKLREAVGARGLVGLLQQIDPQTIQRLKVWTDLMGDGAKVAEYNVETVKKLMEGIQEAGAQWELLKNGLVAVGERLGFITKEALKPWFKRANEELIKLADNLKKIQDFKGLKEMIGGKVQEYTQRGAAGIINRLRMVPGALYRDVIQNPITSWKSLIGEYMEWAPKHIRSETKDFFGTNRSLDVEKVGRIVVEGLRDTVGAGLEKVGETLVELIHGERELTVRLADPNSPNNLSDTILGGY